MTQYKQSYLPGRILKHHPSTGQKNSQKFTREINSGGGARGGKGSSVTQIMADQGSSPETRNKHTTPVNKTFEINRDGAKSSNSLNFSDLESTRIDFEEGTIVAHPILESDNNSDIVIDEKKIVPESSKFKIVFISSESKSGSELNSSMEYPEQASPDHHQDDTLNNVKGDFIDEVATDQSSITLAILFISMMRLKNFTVASDQLAIEG